VQPPTLAADKPVYGRPGAAVAGAILVSVEESDPAYKRYQPETNT